MEFVVIFSSISSLDSPYKELCVYGIFLTVLWKTWLPYHVMFSSFNNIALC